MIFLIVIPALLLVGLSAWLLFRYLEEGTLPWEDLVHWTVSRLPEGGSPIRVSMPSSTVTLAWDEDIKAWRSTTRIEFVIYPSGRPYTWRRV